MGDTVADLIVSFSDLDSLRDPTRLHDYGQVALRMGDAERRRSFAGKIVVIGGKTPADTVELCGFYGSDRYGMEMHADALGNVLSERTIRSVGTGWQLAVMVGLGLIGAFIRVRAGADPHRRSMILLLVLVVTFLVASLVVYIQHQLLVNTTYHIGALLLAYWVTGFVQRRWYR